MRPIQSVTTAAETACLLAHPLRREILALARVPVSASDLARRLDQPRQRVGYHVRQLAEAGFLEPIGQAPKGNMIERLFRASAEAYVVDPAVLGPVAATDGLRDQAGPVHLAARSACSLADVLALAMSAQAANVRPRVLALLEELHFESAVDRSAFLDELAELVSDLIEQYRAPAATPRPFRVFVAAYPPPTE